MIKIVSYALFAHRAGGSWKSDMETGKLEGYLRYLPAIIRAHHVLWPSWTMYLHHDRNVAGSKYYMALLRMQELGLLRLRHCGDAHDLGVAALWRFRPLFEDSRNSVVLSHDIDSFPSWTMRRCAEQFVSSSMAVSVVHGCESHNTAMAGLFMAKSGRFRELVGANTFDEFIGLRPQSFGWYGSDEDYLRHSVWPRVANESWLMRIGLSEDYPSLIKSDQVSYDLNPEELYLALGDVDMPSFRTMGNSFAPYPGAAGFDIERAMTWFEEIQPRVRELQMIDACEQGIATGRETSRL